MLKPADGPTTVAILGEDPIVGHALESLLRSADYAARFFPEYLRDSAEPFEGAKVILILPALSSRRSEAVIARIRNSPATAALPIIELVTAPKEEQDRLRTCVPWPCGIEELKQNIEAVLAHGASSQL